MQKTWFGYTHQYFAHHNFEFWSCLKLLKVVNLNEDNESVCASRVCVLRTPIIFKLPASIQ